MIGPQRRSSYTTLGFGAFEELQPVQCPDSIPWAPLSCPRVRGRVHALIVPYGSDVSRRHTIAAQHSACSGIEQRAALEHRERVDVDRGVDAVFAFNKAIVTSVQG